MTNQIADAAELSKPIAPILKSQKWPDSDWTIKDAMLFYAAKGWRVFPVGRDKRPLIQEWQIAASNEPAQIAKWCEKHPDANIGLLCGPSSDIVVIDIDVKNSAPGMTNAQELASKFGEFSSCLKSRTPSGGRHHFYVSAELPFATSAGKAAKGIDLRADDSGYVLLPPSVGANHCSYTWLETDKDALAPSDPAAPIIPHDVAIAFCFSEKERLTIGSTCGLYEALDGLPRTEWRNHFNVARTFSVGGVQRLTVGGNTRDDLDLDTPYIAKILQCELEAIAEARSDQNDNLTRRAAGIGCILAGIGIAGSSQEAQQVKAQLYDAARSMKSIDLGDPWNGARGVRAIEAAIEGQFAWGLANPRDFSHVKVSNQRTDDDDEDDTDLRPAATVEQVKDTDAEPKTDLTKKNTREAQLVSMANISAKPVQWLWPKRIPKGALSIIAGDPSQGKSQLSCYMAAVISTGRAWCDDESKKKRPALSVILLNAEDAAETVIKPRLLAAKSDVSKIHTFKSVLKYDDKGRPTEGDISLAADMQTLDTALVKLGDVGLVVIDPISAYLGKVDSHNNSEVRGILAPLARLAEKHDVAMVCVSHLNKGSGGKVTDRVTGSLAFSAAARAVYLVGASPDAEEGDETKIFTAGKTNLAAPIQALSYKIEGCRVMTDVGPIETSRIVWKEVLTMSADDLLRGRDDKPDGRKEGKEKLVTWLSTYLADGRWRTFETIEADAKRAGHDKSRRTFERAADEIGVESRRITVGKLGESGSEWCLPKRH